MHFADIDWENLALASNGNCGILLYKNPHLSFASQEPDISYVVHEEIVSTEKAEEPMPLICQAEMVAQVYPTVQEQCEQLVRELSWSTEQSNIIEKKKGWDNPVIQHGRCTGLVLSRIYECYLY